MKKVFIKRKILFEDNSKSIHAHKHTHAAAHANMLTMQKLIYTQNGQQTLRELRRMKRAADFSLFLSSFLFSKFSPCFLAALASATAVALI